jgi:hypothetical protein
LTYSTTGESSDAIYHAIIAEERSGASDSSTRWKQTLTDTRGKESGERWPKFQSEDYAYKENELNRVAAEGSYRTSSPTHNDNGPFWAGDTAPMHLVRRDYFNDLILQADQRDYWPWSYTISSVPASLETVTRYTNYYTTNAAGHWFFVTQELAYLTDNSAAETLLKIHVDAGQRVRFQPGVGGDRD